MVELLAAWLLAPLLLALLCAGAGLLVRRAAPALPAALVAPAGFALLVCAGTATASSDATAELTAPLAIALALAGAALGARRGSLGGLGWPLGAATLVGACYAAPVVISGEATFAGYVKLDDSATWMAITDRIAEHGRSLEGLAPSSYEATLAFNLADGYPIGAFVPLAVLTTLTGIDSAWLLQPYMALIAALLALGLWQLLEPLVARRRRRLAVVVVASQASLLFGYYLWGGVKELLAAALLAATAASAGFALERGLSIRDLICVALLAAATIATLSGGGALWVGPILAAIVLAALPRLGFLASLRRGAGLAGAVAALSLPTLAAGGLLPPTSSPLTSGAAAGNLVEPLTPWRALGVWPAPDFRLDPGAGELVAALLALVAVAAIAGLLVAWSRRASALLLYACGAVAGATVISLAGSPWLGAKAMATVSPLALVAAGVGVIHLLEHGRSLAGALAGVAIVAGVGWSNALAYGGASLAPRSQLAELETIGARIAGQGPTLMTEYQPYGVRHFLREAEPEGASELRRRPVALTRGGTLPQGRFADTDELAWAALRVYRTLVLRRSPMQSRPPSIYRPIWRGEHYEVWQRDRSPGRGRRVLARLGLGGSAEAAGRAACPAVRRLARRAGPNGALRYSTRPPPMVAGLGPEAVAAGGPWSARVAVELPASARWTLWARGSARSGIVAELDGAEIGSIRHQLAGHGQYLRLGTARLATGRHAIGLRYAGPDLHPGSAGPPAALGPLVLSRAAAWGAAVARVPAARATSLCGRRLDWIEAVG